MHIISTFVRGGLREVLATMLNIEAISREDLEDNVVSPVSLSGVSGSISFTGKMSGVLYLNLSEKMAKVATCNILGSTLEKVTDEEVNDVVGELTNMVTGNLKSKMTDQGFNCQLSIPSVLMGKQISIESTQSSIKVYNEFEIKSLKETIRVYVFARLEGAN